jgi:hypothetical protein
MMDIIRCVVNNYGKTFLEESQKDRIDDNFLAEIDLSKVAGFYTLTSITFFY